MSVYSYEIDTMSDPPTGDYMLYIYHDAKYEKIEVCYLTAPLDASMGYAPTQGLTVVENEYSMDCSMKDGEYVSWTPPSDEMGNGSVNLMGVEYDLIDWNTMEPYYYAYQETYDYDYDSDSDSDDEEWDMDMKDWDDMDDMKDWDDMEDWDDMKDWDDEWT